MLVNYVVTTWGGPRRDAGFNPTTTLQKHFECLGELSHSVDAITLVVARDRKVDESPGFEDIVDGISENRDACVIVRENDRGWSYGSFAHAINYWDLSHTKFDYYIFIEDDYAFVVDDFDQRLIDAINSLPEDYGYLAGATDDLNWPFHASLSVGIIKDSAIRKIQKRFGRIPYLSSHFGMRLKNIGLPQVAFSQGFVHSGVKIAGLDDVGIGAWCWRSWDKSCKKKLTRLNDHDGHLFFPIQAMK